MTLPTAGAGSASGRPAGSAPHDLRLLRDGRTLAVAIGGIRTHPATGREKLNLDTMAPALVLMDTADGRIVDRFDMPAALHRLSLRHLAVGRDGAIGAVMQDQAETGELRPLVAMARPRRPACASSRRPIRC